MPAVPSPRICAASLPHWRGQVHYACTALALTQRRYGAWRGRTPGGRPRSELYIIIAWPNAT